MRRTQSTSSLSESDKDFFFVYQNSSSCGGFLWLTLKDEVGFKGMVVWFNCKMILNYIETALGLFLLYLIYFRPYAFQPRVDAAALPVFDLAPGPAGHGNVTLRYDLGLNVPFWNAHRIWAICFNHFTVRLCFNDTQLSPPDDTFPNFKGRTPRHRTLHPVLRDHASNISTAIAEELSWQRVQGWFTVEVRLRGALTYVIWPTWHHYYYEYDCWLHFPRNAMAMLAVTSGVKCNKGKWFGIS